ncbi:hypothetical protein EH165_11040 [Nakamurella antarctica]|uniref:Uncharacterized protein n=1 Tax=Nakamurella antarctica TaxID=1902245 RepID=A0A3G8ZP53_9ACTN|nr:hypothetical protein [Nakamurella antarctica]AZI58587.1 hypothetical protein EH165_11040 [Nakamurella antarctica]
MASELIASELGAALATAELAAGAADDEVEALESDPQAAKVMAATAIPAMSRRLRARRTVCPLSVG